MVNIAQIRAARAMLGWKQFELAERAGISNATVSDIENEIGIPRDSSIAKIVDALEGAGIIFTGDPEGRIIGVAVRADTIAIGRQASGGVSRVENRR